MCVPVGGALLRERGALKVTAFVVRCPVLMQVRVVLERPVTHDASEVSCCLFTPLQVRLQCCWRHRLVAFDALGRLHVSPVLIQVCLQHGGPAALIALVRLVD